MKPGFYCMDCMEALKLFPDKFFDLAIVDPPYGGGYVDTDETDPAKLSGGGQDWQQKTSGRWGQRFARYHISPEADAAWKRTGPEPLRALPHPDPAGSSGGGGVRLAAAQPLRRPV